jgi:hypothetical protein
MAHKVHLFLQAGATEVWLVSEDGDCRVFDAQGPQPASRWAVTLDPGFPKAPS